MQLSFGGEAKELIGYADVDGSMGEDQHALSGYAYLINGGVVSWSIKRQEIVSLSTTESEYVTTTHTAKEGLWLQSLITQLFSLLSGPTTLFLDNQSAITLAKDHQYHAQTKHIDIHIHFIQWIIEDSKLCLIYCPAANMVADSLLRLSHHPRSSTSHPNSDSTMLEGECWRSKHSGVTCSCHPYYPICLTI